MDQTRKFGDKVPSAIKRRWAADYFHNVQLSQALLRNQVPVSYLSPPPHLQVDPRNYQQQETFDKSLAEGGIGLDSKSENSNNQGEKLTSHLPGNTPTNKDSKNAISHSFVVSGNPYVDGNILKYVQGLSENDLRQQLMLRGQVVTSPFKGDLQKQLLSSMQYEKVYQRYYYPQSAPKRLKVSDSSTSKVNSTDFRNVFNYTHHSPPGQFYGGVGFTEKGITGPGQIVQGRARDYRPPIAELDEDPFEFVDAAPVGEKNDNGCMKICEGIVKELKDRRYIGGKGNTKTPLPRQVIELNRNHEKIRNRKPEELICVAFILSHSKLNEKLRVLSKIGEADFQTYDTITKAKPIDYSVKIESEYPYPDTLPLEEEEEEELVENEKKKKSRKKKSKKTEEEEYSTTNKGKTKRHKNEILPPPSISSSQKKKGKKVKSKQRGNQPNKNKNRKKKKKINNNNNLHHEKQVAVFDDLIVKFSSHSSGPYLKLRFNLYEKIRYLENLNLQTLPNTMGQIGQTTRTLTTSVPILYSLDSHSFKTITKKGIKKRERKSREKHIHYNNNNNNNDNNPSSIINHELNDDDDNNNNSLIICDNLSSQKKNKNKNKRKKKKRRSRNQAYLSKLGITDEDEEREE